MSEKISELFDVVGKVAVITGGTGVLGGAMARALGANGAKVAVLGRSAEKGQLVVDDIKGGGGEASFFAVDVMDPADVQRAADQVVATYNTVDILINAAGGNQPGATATPEQLFFDLPDDAINLVMKLNITGTIVPSQVFGRIMADKKEGNIINISSMAAMRPLTKVIGYSASKAAIDNFTYWLSVYMNQNYGEGIRVNAIAPGFFLTEQNRFLLTDKETGDLTPRGETIISQTPMNRFGASNELNGTLLWLCSPAAKFVTGIVVPVDGGFSAFSGV